MKDTALPTSISLNVDMYSATLYMTRDAILALIRELSRIASADPKDCFEIHIGSHFSYMDDEGGWHGPGVRVSEDIEFIRKEDFRSAIETGELDADARMAPFEVTIMHVSQDAVDEERRRGERGA